jgi:V/A-type H+/Na+-transporting ATPase subunit E
VSHDRAAWRDSEIMATKLEEFVARLHAEGVVAGRAEAEQLICEAQARAAAIVAEAEARARDVVTRAEAEAAALAAQRESELRLAARDAILQLRAALGRSLEALVRRQTRGVLDDPDLLMSLVTAVVVEYARSDAAGAQRIEIAVPAGLRQAVEDALLRELAASAAGDSLRVDVKGELAEAGFEYRVGGGGTVEVTTEAVLEVLMGLIRPGLYHLLNGAAPAGPESG